MSTSMMIVVAVALVAAGGWLAMEVYRLRFPSQRADIFAGNLRSISLPPGWRCDHSRWEWREVSRDNAEHTVTEALWVFTQHLETGEIRWRAVGQGEPMYSEGRTFGCLPGTWRQDKRVVPMASPDPLVAEFLKLEAAEVQP